MSDSNGTSDSILIYTNALQSIVLNVPSAHFSTRDIGFNSGLIAVSDNLHNYDGITFTEFGPGFTTASVYFDDETGKALNDFSLPAEFDASDFSYGFAEFSLVDVPTGDRLFVSARISTAAFDTPVPEPSAPAMAATALLLMAATRRRRSTPAQDSATLQNL
ncbi:putative secreted protein with PEP-CTERM sorting signal/MYXO-CTERM domain-containing protein [Herbaspirillum sp. SJZ107]|nr:putative secreted protein with PEP-CTERM sorting signal/MYXO-CTERM domain-containing protein [Herbaspirillum sp. SJZ107]